MTEAPHTVVGPGSRPRRVTVGVSSPSTPPLHPVLGLTVSETRTPPSHSHSRHVGRQNPYVTCPQGGGGDDMDIGEGDGDECGGVTSVITVVDEIYRTVTVAVERRYRGCRFGLCGDVGDVI